MGWSSCHGSAMWVKVKTIWQPEILYLPRQTHYRQCPPKWSPTKMIAREAREKKMEKPKWSLKWSLQNDRCWRQKNENRNDRRNDRAKMIAAALKIDRNEMIAKWSLLALKIDSTCSNSNSDSQRVLVTSGFGLCLEFLSALSSYYGY